MTDDSVNKIAKPEKPRRPTMGDLATIAGVSKITISRALNDSPLVRQPVRQKIQELAERHGYRLNTAARNLRLRRNHSITAVVNMTPSPERTMSDPIFLALVGGVLQVCTEAGYRLILTNTAQLLSSRHDDTDGIIFLGQGSDDTPLREVGGMGLPLLVWGAPRDDDGAWLTVGSDNFQGGIMIASHLEDLGRKDVLFLGNTAYPEVADRLEGLRARACGFVRITVRPCEFGTIAAAAAMSEALGAGWRGDAVIGSSDTIAMGAINALLAAGLHIPHHVAVVGYDGIPAGAAAPIPITTIQQDWEQAGTLLGNKLLQWVDGQKPTSALLEVSLIQRASTIGVR